MKRREKRPIDRRRSPRLTLPASAYQRALFLDTVLLDYLAEVEAMMRLGREMQRHALHLRGRLSVPERNGVLGDIRRIAKSLQHRCETLTNTAFLVLDAVNQRD